VKILNFGSINVDIVLRVQHIVAPGETISSHVMQVNPGGKGANQSVALARAGATVLHAGMVGKDTAWMIDRLNKEGVNTSHIAISDTVNGGQAMIQVDENGQNSIIVYGGANQAIPEAMIDDALAELAPGDWLVLQNEINLTPQLIRRGKAAGINVCFNPSPITPALLDFPLEDVALFMVNEIEGAQLAALPPNTPFQEILAELARRFPNADICMTLGSQGALYFSKTTGVITQRPYAVKAVDTTAAGDTFTGYLLASLAQGLPVEKALDQASRASAIAVSRPGAVDSIPLPDELSNLE